MSEGLWDTAPEGYINLNQCCRFCEYWFREDGYHEDTGVCKGTPPGSGRTHNLISANQWCGLFKQDYVKINKHCWPAEAQPE